MHIIDGKAFASNYLNELKRKIDKLTNENKLTPGLAVVLVGDDPASQIYVSNKIKKAKEVGVAIFEYRFNADISEKLVIAQIEKLNNDTRVHGILVQLPLPAHISSSKVINTINPDKDVDGFTIINIGRLNAWEECIEPSTPKAVLLLIKDVLGNDLSGKKAVVIGRSQIVGRPMASLLIKENCSVTTLHSKSVDVQEECCRADILISAVGVPNMVKANWVKKGACVIDVGIIRVDNKIYGDVDFEEVSNIAEYITPVPGGVGPMTVACMLDNTFRAMCLQKKYDYQSF